MPGFGWGSLPYAEPEPLAPERPSRFERHCSRAVAENVISDAKAAELLDTSVRELHERMGARRPHEDDDDSVELTRYAVSSIVAAMEDRCRTT